uniref:hypothetical protein n=1 Tax=Nocardia cyriacigeorgica TaxID=135487 RepID=UPI002457BA81
KALAELFHILSWLARTYATQPSSKPSPQQQFDPARLPKPGGGAVVAMSDSAVRNRAAGGDMRRAAGE